MNIRNIDQVVIWCRALAISFMLFAGAAQAFDAGSYSSPVNRAQMQLNAKYTEICEKAIDQSIAVDKQQCQWFQNYTRYAGTIVIWSDGSRTPTCHWRIRCKPGIFGIVSGTVKSGMTTSNYLKTLARCDNDYSRIARDCTPVTQESFDQRNNQPNPWLEAVARWCQANPGICANW